MFWHPVTATDCPNPVIGTRPAIDGGTARLYRNGMVYAIDGDVYSLSPGFDSFDSLSRWIRIQGRRNRG
jgi:hypothetical protein